MMKTWKRIIAAFLLAPMIGMGISGAFRATVSASPIPLRGVVEGFYGHPWTQAERLDMIRFCSRHGMNAYLYAPKDDPYHRKDWRKPYPAKKLAELGELAKVAREQNVRFIFAVSPGLDLRFTGKEAEADRQAMLQKMESIYRLGVRDFAIFFDDIEHEDAIRQAEFLNWLQEAFIETHADASPLLTVPTEYSLDKMMEGDGRVHSYTEDFYRYLNQKILVLYTGNRVVGPSLSDEDYSRAVGICNRSLGIWWNYPVTDFKIEKLALGPIENLPVNAEIPALFYNPMEYPELSKITLATGADYARDPANYHADASWRRAIQEQYGELSDDMHAFAKQSTHLENHWANAGRQDGEHLRQAMDAFWESWPYYPDAMQHWETLHREFTDLQASLRQLEKGLPERAKRESKHQRKQLERIVRTDLRCLEMLRARREHKSTDEIYGMFQEIEHERHAIHRNEHKALISEDAACKFIDDCQEFMTGNKTHQEGRFVPCGTAQLLKEIRQE